jgi:2-polyprenyl-6-methoxyphenol hydroxylase-like FAD-dependent oxidoreductase
MHTLTPSTPHIHTGIAGLAVANALQQRGLKVKVFERAPVLDRQRGAGTGLSQNGQLCLHSLGFSHKDILKISTPIQEHILCSGGDVLVRSDYPRRLYDKYGSPLTGM